MDCQFINALLEGDFAAGTCLLNALTEGEFWLRRRGACLIYRGLDTVEAINLSRPVWACHWQDECILPARLSPPPDRDAWYLIRRVGSTGVQEKNTTALLGLHRSSDDTLTLLTRLPQLEIDHA